MPSTKILIIAPAKSGTTVLYQILKDSLSGETVCLFEPQRCEPPDDLDLAGKNVLSKVLLVDTLGDDHYSVGSCSFFDKRIFIRRDPRDQLVSNFLYSSIVSPVTSDFQKFARFCAALKAKEENPRRISFLDLWRLQGQLCDDGPLVPLEKCLARLRFSLRVLHRHRGGLFPVAYEDIVDRRLWRLEDYLGMPLSAAAEVDPQYRRVARTKGYGDWRNWFLPSDVGYFRPLLADLMEGFGYDDGWELPESPAIRRKDASGYLAHLAEERGEFATLDYEIDTFPFSPDLLAGARFEPSAFRIDGLRPKCQEVYALNGAQILDPHVETTDHETVNVLIQGERYLYAYDVEFHEDCPGVSCWMTVTDQHGETVARNSTSFHDLKIDSFAGYTVRVEFDFACNWKPGIYFLNAGVTTSSNRFTLAYAHRVVRAAAIIVSESRPLPPRRTTKLP